MLGVGYVSDVVPDRRERERERERNERVQPLREVR